MVKYKDDSKSETGDCIDTEVLIRCSMMEVVRPTVGGRTHLFLALGENLVFISGTMVFGYAL